MEKISKNKKLYLFNILFLLITLLVLCVIEFHNSLKFSFFDKINFFDLLTLSSIIAGFLFSSFCLLIGLYDTVTVELMERSNYLDKIVLSHELGFIFSVLSIFISIICIFITIMNVKLLQILEFLGIYSLIISLLYFLLSMYYVYEIVNMIRKRKKEKSQNILNISLKNEQ